MCAQKQINYWQQQLIFHSLPNSESGDTQVENISIEADQIAEGDF